MVQLCVLSSYRYRVIDFAQSPKTYPPHCNAQQAILALKAYFSIGAVHLGEFIWEIGEINKEGNLEPTGNTKINGFLTNTTIGHNATKRAG